jgi:hypothetical protein
MSRVKRHPFFDEIEASLAPIVPRDAVTFAGGWLASARRTYATAGQRETESAPFVDVIDLRWRGTLTCQEPVAGLVLLMTDADVFWVKTRPPTLTLSVDISLHAYADYSADRATFTANVGGAVMPGIPVTCGPDLGACCSVAAPCDVITGRPEQLAHTETAALAVLLLQGRLLEVGRKRLWRVRQKLASSLPPVVRGILTQRRTGAVPPPMP